ncbi:DUF6876 family protein [Cysteiniphilum litorale]|uniref:DUF6876 family protein n=1 Tax=Cysteiniphilum litorale TaxID=2056700 RepID=UPI003F884DAA
MENLNVDNIDNTIDVSDDETDQGLQKISLANFLNEFKSSLVEQVKSQITPLYKDSSDNDPYYHELMSQLKRKPFEAQENAVQALMKLFVEGNRRMGILNGEMGTGKSMMGICIANLMHHQGFKRTLILCPPHLVYKWKREIENTINDVDVVILNGSGSIRTLNKIREHLKRYGRHRPAFFIVGRVRLRMGGNWQHAFARRKLAVVEQSTNESLDSDVLCCGDCGEPVKHGDSYFHDIRDLPQKQHTCCHCNSKLWQYGIEKKTEESNYDKLRKALCQLPTIGKVKATNLLNSFGEDLLLNSLEDNLYQMINLIDEQGEFVFNDNEARRLEKAIMKNEFALSNVNFQVSEFIKRYFPRNYFGLLMCDEAHEYKNGGSAQGQAMGVVASQCQKVLLLTGTLMGGYASDLFYLLHRSMPSVMNNDGYCYSDHGSLSSSVQSFLETYGILKFSYSEKEAENFKTARGRNRNVSATPAPGFSVKGVARYLLPYTVFVRLEDIDADALVPYTEHDPIMLDMEDELNDTYAHLSSKLKSEMEQALAKGDRTLLGTVLSALMSYSDSAFMPMTVCHPRTGNIIADADALIGYEPSVKEQALIDLCVKQKSQNRRVLVYSTLTDKRDTRQRLKEFLTREGIKAEILNSSVSTQQREDWVMDKVDRGIDVLITNPKLVETGLDLLDFPSIVFMQVGYNVYTAMQAMRRSWRIGQTVPVEIFFICYKGTAQQSCLELMAKKIKVTQSTSGEMPNCGLEALNQDADNMETAIARKLINKEDMSQESEAQMIQSEDESCSTSNNIYNKDVKIQLRCHMGDNVRYRIFNNTIITPGVKDLAEKLNCYWLIQDAAIFLSEARKKKNDYFYSVTFSQKTGRSVLTIDDGNNRILYESTYNWVDLTAEEDICLYLATDDDPKDQKATFVMMLPTEY